MKRRLFLLFTFLAFLNLGFGQFLPDSMIYSNDTSLFKHKLYFQFNTSSFLRNNEYFNELYDGITFLGTNINPYFSCRFNDRLTLSAGLYSRYFWGKPDFYINSLFYRMNYTISSKLQLIAGNIYGYDFHRLTESIYSTDYFYFNKPETGIQFLFSNKRLTNDLWLNWEKFILPGDNYKEEFLIGNHSKIMITKPANKAKITIPVQFLAKHKGGQGTTSSAPLQTYFNWASGLNCSYSFNKQTIGIQSLYVQFNDVSDKKILRYTDGYGIHSTAFYLTSTIELYAGYWYGEFYYSPVGEPLFQSLSKKYVNYSEPSKKVFLFKFKYKQVEIKNTLFSAQFECYYDYQRRYFDFSYGFTVRFADKFFLTNLPATYE